MLDRDLAVLYGVETRVLNQSVSRNMERFPENFMFLLTRDEFDNLKSQIVTSSWGGVRKLPRAFTEQGVAMLSGVLRSPRSIRVNIEIMRTFTKIREMLSHDQNLKLRLDDLESRFDQHDEQIKLIFDMMRKLFSEPEKPKKKIGF